MKRKRFRKATDLKVSQAFLQGRVTAAAKNGWPKACWIEFCEAMLDRGFVLILYEARQTFSKYITVCHYGRSFKVRFSNHKAIRERERAGDCDFFVGRGHFRTTTTEDAIKATIKALS